MIVFRVLSVEDLRMPETEGMGYVASLKKGVQETRTYIADNGPKPKVKIELVDPRMAGRTGATHETWETDAAPIGIQDLYEWRSNNEHAFYLDNEYYTRTPKFKITLINAKDNSTIGVATMGRNLALRKALRRAVQAASAN
jgi:hypothetical protein